MASRSRCVTSSLSVRLMTGLRWAWIIEPPEKQRHSPAGVRCRQGKHDRDCCDKDCWYTVYQRQPFVKRPSRSEIRDFEERTMTTSKPGCTIGVFSIGLAAYWPQFEGLRDRLAGYGRFVAERLGEFGARVVDVGMVDDQPAAMAAADRFIREDVDLVVCYVTTYSTSSQVLPAVQRVKRPVLILNLQPTAQLNYARTGTGEWLANCQACCVPEIACAFERCGIAFHTVTGLLGLDRQTPGAVADEVTAEHPAAKAAWEEIRQWIDATRVQRTLSRSRI